MPEHPTGYRGPGRRRQLPDEVATYVRELIVSGQVRPGQFLRMEPIAEAVGVSNTPVREGLLALSSEGLVELVPRRGFMVAAVSRQDVRDLFWAQAQFAAELAARAARLLSPCRVDAIEAIEVELADAVGRGDQAAIATHGHRFHREINLGAESRRLSRLLGAVVRTLPDRFYASMEGHLATARDDHRELVAALRARNARRARAVAERHILRGADDVVAMLEERGMWAAREPAS